MRVETSQAVASALTHATAVFRQRAIVTAMGLDPNTHVPGCRACGRFDCDHADVVFAGVVPGDR